MRIAIVVATEPGVRPLGLSGNFESNLAWASKFGYDGVELFLKDPSRLNVEEVRKTAERFSLAVPAVGTGATYTAYGLSLSSPNRAIRERAIKRVREYLEIGRALNSRTVIGLMQGKPKDRERGLRNLRCSLKKCAENAEEIGARILIEPLNRYETNLVNTLEEAIELKKELGSDMIGVMADTFHMNIEEKSVYESLIRTGSHLDHMHFADSNRLAPGQGHLDFKKIANALRKANYESFVTVEILPLPGPHVAAKIAIEHLRTV